MNLLSGFFLNTVYLLCYCLMFVFIGGLVIEIIEKKSNYYLQRSFGYGGILITGLGTVVHELSHLIFVVLGAMKPTEVKLFRPIQGKIDGVLGYVSYVEPGSNSRGILKLYNKLFLIPIGIAPIIGGTLTILGSLKICLPNTFSYLINEIKSLNINVDKVSTEMLYSQLSLTKSFLGNLFTMDNMTNIRFWIFIFIVLSIASHMSLSTADIKGCLRGLPYLLIVIVLTGIILIMQNNTLDYIYNAMKIYNGYVVTFLSIAIMFSTLNLCIILIINLFFKFVKK